MFARLVDQGRGYAYVTVVESIRRGDHVEQRHVCSLGRVERLDPIKLLQLAESLRELATSRRFKAFQS